MEIGYYILFLLLSPFVLYSCQLAHFGENAQLKRRMLHGIFEVGQDPEGREITLAGQLAQRGLGVDRVPAPFQRQEGQPQGTLFVRVEILSAQREAHLTEEPQYKFETPAHWSKARRILLAIDPNFGQESTAVAKLGGVWSGDAE